jgi:DNA-binding IclR family transcriptional regulator
MIPERAMTTKSIVPQNSALSRSFSLLEAVLQAGRPVSATDLGSMLELPKPTAHRLALQLESENLLQRDAMTKLFLPGPRLRSLATAVLGNSLVRAPVQGIMQRLSVELGETCNLVVLDGCEVVYRERVESGWPLGVRFDIGTRLPLYCTASGKLLLSCLSRRRRRALVELLSYERHTDNTVTGRVELEKELDRTGERGVGTDDEEMIAGMVAVAVPVRSSEGTVVAALTVHAPAARRPLSLLLQQVPTMTRYAEALSQVMAE